MATRSIIVGGGCFWCVESVYRPLKGVVAVESGYAGGHDKNPTYKAVCQGTTGHTEVIRVTFEEAEISLTQILEMFFVFHNPTTLNRQGNDVGTQYRSAIYYTDDTELPLIQEAIVEAEKNWGLPIVTEVARLNHFYIAEDYHQDYYTNNPQNGYCQYAIEPKMAKLRSKYSHLLKTILLLLLAIGQTFAQTNQPLNATLSEPSLKEAVPTLRINFYLLGMHAIDESITVQVGENIEHLNTEFEGEIRFVLNDLIIDPTHEYLPFLHEDYYTSGSQAIQALVEPIERKGSINVYVCKTFALEGTNSELTGFTPILKAKEYAYKLNSPQFDRIFISYSGLESQSTLVHELGHFLGLKHPWEMPSVDRDLQGLSDPATLQTNHMTYALNANDFTNEQLARMRHFAKQFRGYLTTESE